MQGCFRWESSRASVIQDEEGADANNDDPSDSKKKQTADFQSKCESKQGVADLESKYVGSSDMNADQ